MRTSWSSVGRFARHAGRAACLCTCAALSAPAAAADAATTDRFDIQRFAIAGSHLLPDARLQELVAPFTGPQRDFGDVQRAVEAVEFAYRKLGYAAVLVYAPEQELVGGTVNLQVVEATVGAVSIEGQPRYFDTGNLRAAMPALVEGTTPNARDLSAQIALTNENPAKQIEVVLGVGAREGTVDARLTLAESDPVKIAASLDNTGSAQTGQNRLGISLQHANLWNSDHVGVVAYQTSPEKPEQVAIYSLSYRLPVYAWAGAFDFILAKSNVNAGTTATTAGDLAFAGSGTVFGLHYTQALPRAGDVTQKLTLGWDIKANDNTCTLGPFGAAGCGAAAADVTLRPLSLSYNRLSVAPGQATELTGSIAANLKGGNHGREADFNTARPGTTGGAAAGYTVLRGSLTHLRVFDGDWQARFVANAQWAPRALLPQEQFSLAGSNNVRGFNEREVARDTGLQVNLEGYTPNLADIFHVPGSLRALAFLDAATGRNHLLAGETRPRPDLASWGIGLRYGAGKDVSAKLDVAQVVTANGSQERGDWRGHFRLMLTF